MTIRLARLPATMRLGRSPKWLKSEFDEACALCVTGDPWPLAILQFKAGEPDLLLDLIEEDGLPAGSAATAFVLDILSGKYKPTKGDRAVYRRARVISNVEALYWWMRESKSDPIFSSLFDDIPKSLEDIYNRVADALNMTPDAVEQIIKRNRRRIRAGDKES